MTASSATVKVLVSFYLVPTDKSGSSARTSAIHKVKFNVLPSGDEPTGLFRNMVKHLKAFTGLAEIAKSKGLGEKPKDMMVISCSFIILRYRKLFFWQEPLKMSVNLK